MDSKHKTPADKRPDEPQNAVVLPQCRQIEDDEHDVGEEEHGRMGIEALEFLYTVPRPFVVERVVPRTTLLRLDLLSLTWSCVAHVNLPPGYEGSIRKNAGASPPGRQKAGHLSRRLLEQRKGVRHGVLFAHGRIWGSKQDVDACIMHGCAVPDGPGKGNHQPPG